MNDNRELAKRQIRALIRSGYLPDTKKVWKLILKEDHVYEKLSRYRAEIGRLRVEIKDLKEKGKLKQAYRLTKQHLNCPILQSIHFDLCIQLSKKEKNLNRKKAALYKVKEALSTARRYPNNVALQVQLMGFYISLKEYSKALEISNRYPNCEQIIGKKMICFVNQQMVEEAEDLASQFPHNFDIQKRLIALYVKRDDFTSLLAMRKAYKGNPLIVAEINRVLDRCDMGKSLDHCFFGPEDNSNSSTLHYLQNKIYQASTDPEMCGDISRIIMENETGLTPWQQTILLIESSELHGNREEMKRIAKEYLRKTGDLEHAALLKMLVQTNRKIFDYGLYDNLLCIKQSSSNRKKGKQKTKTIG